MDKKTLYINIGNGLLISHKKEVNPTIGDNMDKSGVYYTTWNNPDKVKYVWYQLYMEFKTKQKRFHETDMLVARGWGEMKMGDIGQRV